METVATTKRSTIKAYKENKPFIEKYITSELPKIFKEIHYKVIIPGYLYLNHGISYLGSEQVDPCTDYQIPVTELQEENLDDIFKKEFKRRGEQGLMLKIKEVKAIHEMQKEKFPHLFK